MVNTCWIRGCKNRADDDEKKRSYFSIPKIREHEGEQTKELSKERRRKWLANIKRKAEPSKYSKICSDHFIGGKPADLYDKTHPDWAPTLKLDLLTTRKSSKKVKKVETHLKRKMELQPEKTGVCTPHQSLTSQKEQSQHIGSSPQEQSSLHPETIFPVNYALSTYQPQIPTIVKIEASDMPTILNQTDGQPDVQRRNWPLIPVIQQPGFECNDWSSMPNISSIQTQSHIQGINVCQKKRYYHIILIVTVEQEEAIVDLFKHRQWEYVKAGQNQTCDDIQEMCAKMQDVNSNAHSSDIQIEANAHQDSTENDATGSINYISDLDTLSDEMTVTDNDYIQVKQERETENDETGRDDSLIGETTLETRQSSMTGTFISNIVSKPHASLVSATDIGTQINDKIEYPVLNRAASLMTDQNTFLLQPSINPAQSLPALGAGIVGSPMLRLGIRCENCEAIFTNKMEFKNHLANKKCIWVCKLCKKVFVSSYRTIDKDHIYSIFNEKLAKHKNDCDQTCKLCGRSFRESAQYRLHMKRRHSKDKQFACDVCFFDFKSEGAMHSHKMNKHSVDSDVYTCPMCPREYSTLQPLKDHFRSTHLRRKKIEVCCTICGKKCESGRNIKEHEETHKVKDIPCDQCPAMFNTQRLLKTHQRRHKKDYSHFCEVCAKPFYSLTKLKEHHRSHTGEKPYTCPKCDYRCSSSGNFRKHMKIHDKPSSGHQQCSICKYSCRLKDTLDKHMKIHDKPSSGDHQ